MWWKYLCAQTATIAGNSSLMCDEHLIGTALLRLISGKNEAFWNVSPLGSVLEEEGSTSISLKLLKTL